jgi:hypothetical protein
MSQLGAFARSAAVRLAWPAAAMLGLTLVGCGTLEFEPIPAAQVDQARQTKAGEFATTLLQAWGRNEYPALGGDATDDLKKAHGAEAQKEADQQLEKAIGSFKSMSFAEANRSKPPKLEIYRFKGAFDKTAEPVEVRVVLDPDGKVSGFWVKPWKDKL